MTYSDIAFARRSLSHFGIDGSLKRVSTGLDVTWRVTAGEVFALRVAGANRRVSAFRVEAGWIDDLSGNAWFRVPAVQRTGSGDLVAQVEDGAGGVRASTLLSWLPGRRRRRIGLAEARSLGRIAGTLHRRAGASALPSRGDIKSWDARLMCLMPQNPGDGLQKLDAGAAAQVQQVFLALQRVVALLDAREIGLINADLGLHNVLWGAGGPALVDFNDAGIGPYAFCLARLVGRMRLLGETPVAELLRGYREVTTLPPCWEEYGDLFELAADVFRLNYGAARAVRAGMALQPPERRIVDSLAARIEKLGPGPAKKIGKQFELLP